jgi:hypothetical protein
MAIADPYSMYIKLPKLISKNQPIKMNLYQ